MDNRTEWLKWRKNGIGSSDAAAIYDEHPYMTRLELWEQKTSNEEPVEKSNFILEKGNRMEPLARALFCAQYGIEHGSDDSFEPRVLELEEYPFMRASLDGFHADRHTFIEIKYQGKEAHESGRIPRHYWIQMMHQFLVSGAQEAYFVSTNDGMSIKVQRVAPDLAFMESHLKKCEEFWRSIVERKEPSPGIRDYKNLRGVSKDIQNWKQLKRLHQNIADKLSEVQDRILAAAKEKGHPRLLANDVRIAMRARIGSIDYAKIPELKGVDLEKYRKPSSSYWQMTVTNEGEK